jgi:hypothetical protein
LPILHTFPDTVTHSGPPSEFRNAKKRDSLSRVTYELTPMGHQVRLRLVRENLLPEDVEKDPNTFQGVNNDWPAVLSSLRSLLETGEAINFSAH